MASLTQWIRVWENPGDSEGQGSLAGCRPWGHQESDTTESLNNKILPQTPLPSRLWWGPFLTSLLNLLHHCFCCIFCLQGMWDLAPQPGIKPTPLTLEGKVLISGPPRKSPAVALKELNYVGRYESASTSLVHSRHSMSGSPLGWQGLGTKSFTHYPGHDAQPSSLATSGARDIHEEWRGVGRHGGGEEGHRQDQTLSEFSIPTILTHTSPSVITVNPGTYKVCLKVQAIDKRENSL